MALGGLLWLTGCASPKLEGTWEGQRKIEGPAHIVGTAGKIALTLHDNGRYELQIHSMPVTGRYEIKEKKVTLTALTAAGRDLIPATGASLFGEGAYATIEGKALVFHDVNGPNPEPIRLEPKPAANPVRNP